MKRSHFLKRGRAFVRAAPVVRGMLLAALAGALPAQAAEPAAATPEETLVGAARSGVVGARAPAFRLETLEGETIDLAEVYGEKAVYLKFWATWCIPCRAQMPHFENVYQNAGDDLAVIGINAGINETLEDIQDFREDYAIHMPIVVDDGALASAFNLRITPQHVVIGKDGTILHVGQQADAELDQALQQARSTPATASPGYVGPDDDSVPRFDEGDFLPAETLQTHDGTRFALRDAGEQSGTVLVFMIPWCESYLADTRPAAAASCRQVREQVEALRQRGGNVRWLGINSGLWTLAGDLREYEEQYDTMLPLALDEDSRLFRAFGIMTMPTIIVADASGRIVRRMEGYDADLENAISSLSGTGAE